MSCIFVFAIKHMYDEIIIMTTRRDGPLQASVVFYQANHKFEGCTLLMFIFCVLWRR